MVPNARARAAPARRIATIGVYEFDAASFVATLDGAGVTRVLDIRQRRGVRGSRYSWANAQRLQVLLASAGIGYEHHPELAPDTEMRHLQYREDDRQGVGKRSRVRLAPEYVREYTEEILDLVPLQAVVSRLPGPRARRADVRGNRGGGLSPLARRRTARRALRSAGGRSRAAGLIRPGQVGGHPGGSDRQRQAAAVNRETIACAACTISGGPSTSIGASSSAIQTRNSRVHGPRVLTTHACITVRRHRGVALRDPVRGLGGRRRRAGSGRAERVTPPIRRSAAGA